MDRSIATRWTRFAQAGLAAGVVVVGGVSVMSMPGGSVQQPPEQATLPDLRDAAQTADAGADRGQAPRVQGTQIAARMGLISNRPKAPEPPPTQPTTDQPAPSVPPTTTDIRYLGMVSMGQARRALVHHASRQRFVAVGDSLGGEDVEVIEPDHIMVGGKKYELPQRAGDVLTRTAPGQGITTASAGMGKAGSPEEQAAIRARFDAAMRGKVAPDSKQGMMNAMEGRWNSQVPPRFRPPEYVPPEDAELWRKIRAQLIMGGQHAGEDIDSIAAKLIDERREDLMKSGTALRHDELIAEQEYDAARSGGRP